MIVRITSFTLFGLKMSKRLWKNLSNGDQNIYVANSIPLSYIVWSHIEFVHNFFLSIMGCQTNFDCDVGLSQSHASQLARKPFSHCPWICCDISCVSPEKFHTVANVQVHENAHFNWLCALNDRSLLLILLTGRW